ncbi:hypothetical protein ABIC28_004808 [Rhodococcus sp. PvR044]|uniref:hypothetical protein n=1 Tax=unclassified Rhodococcus (in: high G+C Gram-positive bacteria) TaxID=192944 RepID=UPI000BC3CA54|nr:MULTISPECIES: hypothetical protein [unclassified Rhodococcus (in: high G+C Gram-positive bacteria)]PTR43608.1 hypothetical protein C8K38_107215 [Rhodococcus sp. OK611]SNX90953.1 hypothetical protein SAMN05447004_107215 [Rhodococcus sp. OK270]
MGTLKVTDNALHLTLSTLEKIGALHGDVEVPLSSILAVDVCPDGLSAPRGMRAPGLGVPGWRKLGTWRSRGRREFVDVRRGQPAVRVELAGQSFAALLVGVDDPQALARRLGGLSG